MKIRIWGARGSVPSPITPDIIEEKIVRAIFSLPQDIGSYDLDTIRTRVAELPFLLRGTAGGNTTCVQIESGGETFIIDAGSGIRNLGFELMKGPCGEGKGTLHLFFTHPHWDHIQGFPFFRPAFISGNKIFIYSIHDLEMALTDQQRFLNFPVSLSYMQATMKFIHIDPGKAFEVGPLKINTIENVHPGKAYAYRFEDHHSTFVFASDSEYKDLDTENLKPYLDFFKGADALIFDAQYTLRENFDKPDWGHSSAWIGVDLARSANVKRLLLFHHDPTYSDSDLEEMQLTAINYQAEKPSLPGCEVIVAYEGLTLDLTPLGTADLQLMSDGETAILTPTSLFDEFGVDQLAQHLTDTITTDNSANSIIDLSQVETLTTASLKSLINLHRQRSTTQVVLAAPSKSIQKIIDLSGYSDIFAIYPSVEAAFSAFQASQALNLPGQVVDGRYQIINKIGESRLAATLKAIDTVEHQTIALKIISPTFSRQAIHRFIEQSQQLIRLNHRHIVDVLSVGQDGHYSFIVEEFVTRQTLEDYLIVNQGILSIDQAMNIIMDLTLALEYAHSRGITHGDIQPRNIFITEDGAKLTNFGMGRLEENRPLLNASLLFLSAPYLAPEQIQGEPTDARTDLYALGAILYEMLAGRPPFTGTDQEIMEAHLDPDRFPISLKEQNPNVSITLEHLVWKLLAKNPNNRYANVRQTRHICNNLLIGSEEGPYPRRNILVGRDKQLEKLKPYWDKVCKGQGQLIFITGEPGIGKTSLAQELTSLVGASVVLNGRCQELPGSPAYYAFSEALQNYFGTVPRITLDEEIRQLLSYLTTLAPQIHQMITDLPEPPPLTPKQEQLRLMTSLTQFIKRTTQNRPWFLILDDLHWADTNTLDLLHYLGRHLPKMPLMIVGTYLDEEVGRGHPLQHTLTALNQHPTYYHCALERLDELGVERILADMWEDSIPSSIVKKIYQHTGGNPFYVKEVARGLVDDGLVTLKDGKHQYPILKTMRLPQTVREVVWRRIHHLNPDTEALLLEAAVLGQTFSFEDLAVMSKLSQWEVMEHLLIAVERNLIEEAPGEGLFRFSQTEIHTVLYTDLSPLRRRMLHRLAGQALERHAEPLPVRISETLAYHFAEANEFEPALLYSIQAARRAEDAYANEAALMWYIRILNMIDRLDVKEVTHFQSVQLTIYKSAGKLLSLMGRYDEALENFNHAQSLVKLEIPTQSQASTLADLCLEVSKVYKRRGEYEQAFNWLKNGLEHLKDLPKTLEAARIYLTGATLYFYQGDNHHSIEWSQRSLDIALKLDDYDAQPIVGQAWYRLGAIYIRIGDFERGIELCKESIKIFDKTNDLTDAANSYNNMANAYIGLGQWPEASTAYEQSLKISKDIGDLYQQAIIIGNHGYVYLYQGDLEQALILFEQSQVIWNQLNIAWGQATVLIALAQIYIFQQQWSKAEKYLNRSQKIINNTEMGDEVNSELVRAWSNFYLETNQLDQALNSAKQAVKLATELNSPLEDGRSQRILGNVYTARQEYNHAETALNHSLKILKAVNSIYQIAKTQLSYAQLYNKTQVPIKAKSYLTDAKATFEQLGAKIDLAIAEDLLKQIERGT